MRTATDEKFENVQPKAFLHHQYISEEIETEHLQSYLPCPGDNLFKNDTVRALGLTKLNENSGFLFS